MIGALAGAFLGGLLGAVGLSILLLDGDFAQAARLAPIGCAFGAMAGLTCRPILGAVIGGGLFLVACLLAVGIPLALISLFAYANQNMEWFTSGRLSNQIVRVFAMTVPGAIAGGSAALLGAWTRGPQKSVNTESHPDDVSAR